MANLDLKCPYGISFLLRKNRSRSRELLLFICPVLMDGFFNGKPRLEMPLRHFIFASQKSLTFAGAAASLLHHLFGRFFKWQTLGLKCPYGISFLLRKNRSRSRELLQVYCTIFLDGFFNCKRSA